MSLTLSDKSIPRYRPDEINTILPIQALTNKVLSLLHEKLVIVGCGRLAGIVADAVVKGLLPDYDLVGVYSRTASKAAHIVHKCSNMASIALLAPHWKSY